MTAWAADDVERGFVTFNPARSDMLGLATQDGHYAIVLAGEDCAEPGNNVLIETAADGAVTLQAIAPITAELGPACSVGFLLQVDHQPCRQNPDGRCDVAY
jgi:hypothetical protein